MSLIDPSPSSPLVSIPFAFFLREAAQWVPWVWFQEPFALSGHGLAVVYEAVSGSTSNIQAGPRVQSVDLEKDHIPPCTQRREGLMSTL